MTADTGPATGSSTTTDMTSLPPQTDSEKAAEGQQDNGVVLDLSALLGVLGYTTNEHVAIGHGQEGGVFTAAVMPFTEAAGFVADLPDNENIYFEYNPNAGPARDGRSSADDITRLAALPADLDVKRSACKDIETAHAIIDELSSLVGTRPSAITDSGHGLHPYWPVLDGQRDNGIDIGATLKRWGRLVKAVAEKHGARVDNIFDLPRVLRVPGTFNNKAATNGHAGAGALAVVCHADTGHPLTVTEVDARLTGCGIPEEDDDRQHREVVSHPDTWAFADATCGYVKPWLDKLPADGPNPDGSGGRHQWLLSQAVRLSCAWRLGCITEADYQRVQELLDDRMVELCRTREPKRSVPLYEVPGAFEYGIEKAATKTEAEARAEVGDHKHPTPDGERVIRWRTGNDIRDDVPEWAMTYHGKGCMQRGTLVLYAGRPGAGKSTAGRWTAAGYTNGTIEGCFYGQPQKVAYIASEESLQFMVKPSLRAHGADMSRIHFPHVEINGEEVRLNSKEDEARLTKALIALGITVVFVDPVMSAIGSKVNINNTNEVRECIEPWARIARAINGLVICIVHLTKAPGGDIVAAINGSSAFGEVARAVIAFAKDQQSTEGIRVLSQEKNNAGTEDLALEYVIEGHRVQTDAGKAADVGKFVIKGPSDRRVSDVLQVDPKERNVAKAGTKMCEVLECVRAAGHPMAAATVAQHLGISTDMAGKYLRRLFDSGFIAKAGRGLFEYREHGSGEAQP